MFAADYFAARECFQRLSPVEVISLPLAIAGPRGESLSIDIVWLGSRAARRVVLVTSGIHGVEGFAGSALQCALLARAPRIPADAALVLVHALNPWGFAHLRRVNERNVDLNRNFLLEDRLFTGAAAGYQMLDAFLNPSSPPANDGFYLRALATLIRHGMAPLRAAIASGQYQYPRGLFYGGLGLEPGARLYLDWLRARVSGAQRLVAIDIHTGLGRFGAMTVFADRATAPERARRIGRLLGEPVVGAEAAARGGGYLTRGSLDMCMREALPVASADCLTVEFGTYPGIAMLHALREENRWHHFGEGTLTHPAKQRLRAAFCPDSERWRAAVLERGTRLLERAIDLLVLE